MSMEAAGAFPTKAWANGLRTTHIALARHVATPLDKACFDVLNAPYTFERAYGAKYHEQREACTATACVQTTPKSTRKHTGVGGCSPAG